MLNQNLLLADDGYNIQRSLRFRSSASAYLSRATVSTGNPQKLTWSGWVKRGALGTVILFSNAAAGADFIGFSSDSLRVSFAGGTSALVTNAVYRDTSAWYHVFVSIDTTQATASNRVLIWINGVAVTSFSSATYPAQNANTSYNTSGTAMFVGQVGSSLYLDGYMTEVNFIDGQALSPSSFGEIDIITGVWKPKKYAGTYGTNGFYLNFSDNSSNTATTIGKDYSGNGNNWTPNNISVTAGATYDSMTDVPTLTSATQANYCVWNPLKARSTTLLTNGNLSVSSSDAGSAYCAFTSIVMSSQKWYAEYTVTTFTGGYPNIGIGDLVISENSNRILGDTNGASYHKDGTVYINGTNVGSFASFTNGDVIGVAYDATNNRLYFSKNNTWINSADPANGTGYFSPAIPVQGYVFATSLYSAASLSSNFGQRPFAYTPPTGFVALNTFNLPEPSIKAGNKHFDATTYTGNATARSIVNTGGFQPDLVWIKERSGVGWNIFTDSVRGVTKNIYSNSTNAEATNNGTDITSFNSDGFSLGTDSNGDGVNRNGNTVVAWQWKAGGSAVSNTAGSITSQVSANPSAGFSVVTYTGNNISGATVGHGLGVAPKMIIVKNRDQVGDWCVYHQNMNSTPQNYYMQLNLTSAAGANSTIWNNTAPTSSVFSIGSYLYGNNIKYTAYCFSEVAGYSKFGTWAGNGSSDGTFVHLGFKPALVISKRIDSTSNWTMRDNKRAGYNDDNDYLCANLADAEANGSTYPVDLLSNGFKFRTTDGNVSGGSYIYMAFAENPFKYSLAR